MPFHSVDWAVCSLVHQANSRNADAFFMLLLPVRGGHYRVGIISAASRHFSLELCIMLVSKSWQMSISIWPVVKTFGKWDTDNPKKRHVHGLHQVVLFLNGENVDMLYKLWKQPKQLCSCFACFLTFVYSKWNTILAETIYGMLA